MIGKKLLFLPFPCSSFHSAITNLNVLSLRRSTTICIGKGRQASINMIGKTTSLSIVLCLFPFCHHKSQCFSPQTLINHMYREGEMENPLSLRSANDMHRNSRARGEYPSRQSENTTIAIRQREWQGWMDSLTLFQDPPPLT